MKKTFLYLFLSGFLTAMAMASSVEVTNPTGGITWVKGQAYLITWTKTGDMPANVKITLRNQNSTAEVLEIANPAPNSGSYSWLVPASVPAGSFHIRVKVKNVAVQDDSDLFHIGVLPPPPPPAPFVTVTKPAAGETWRRDTTCTITWTKNGTMPGSVKIDLMNKDGLAVVKPIADITPNTGSYPWTVPGDTTLGDYRVRVQVKTTAIQDDSEVFHVGFILPSKAKTISKLSVAKTHNIPAINVLNLSCWGGSPVSGISKCAVWGNVMPIFQARPTCLEQLNYSPGTAMVGADHFNYMWEGGSVPITAYKASRARLGFDVSDFMGKGADIIEAKLHLTQLASVRSGTSDLSCGVSWWFLKENPVQSGVGWTNVPIDSSCHGNLNWWETDYGVDVSCAVQRWVDGGYPNFGIILISRWEDLTSEIWTCFSCFKAELIIKVKEH
jgi:hypothetical protein